MEARGSSAGVSVSKGLGALYNYHAVFSPVPRTRFLRDDSFQ